MKTAIPYRTGKPLADKVIKAMAPWCERIEIAGSLRRKVNTVGDIELVCIPKRQPDLFGNLHASLLTPHLDYLVDVGKLLRGNANGDRYKKFHFPSLPDLQLDLFITTPCRWPVIYAIRTGSKDYSRRLVTQRQKGGMLPSIYSVHDGYLWAGGQLMKLSSEREFLELCGGWVEPEDRI